MRAFKIIFIISALFLLPSYSYSSNLALLRTKLIEGDVQIKTEDTSEWLPVAINMPLREGDRLWVPESGRLEIQMSDGSFLRLDEDSSLVIHAADEDIFRFYLSQGHAYVNFRGLGDGVIQIDTPLSSVYTHNRSKFRMDLLDYGYSRTSVFKGVIYVEGINGLTEVHAGETLSLKGDRYADISPLGPSDEWERWNRDRDERFEGRMYSARYLPDELKIYSYDFDENGKWVYVSEYGYVWVPTTVVLTSGWAPYKVGEWVWIGDDYIWVSYEPWGWAPYHYGRWAFKISIGWFWVPPVSGAVYWGPGFVGWVYTPSYVAWIPLAPEDIYYGYGYYGPQSVNIFNIHIHKTIIKNKYKNAYVKKAVTVVYKDSFVEGRYVDFRLSANPFLKGKVNIGRPEIKRKRKTFKSIVKRVPSIKQSPQPIRKEVVRALPKRHLYKENNNKLIPSQKNRYLRNGKGRMAKRSTAAKYKDIKFRRQVQTTGEYHKQRYESIRENKLYKKPVIGRKHIIKSKELRYVDAKTRRGITKKTYINPFKKRQKSEYTMIDIRVKGKGYTSFAKGLQKRYRAKDLGDYINIARFDNMRNTR